jgi:hypothetical protein
MPSYTGCCRTDGSLYADCQSCPRPQGGWKCVVFLEKNERTRVRRA